MTHLAVFIIGALAGLLISALRMELKSEGTLKIDDYNPNKDIYRLCIDDLDALDRKRRIVVKIERHVDLSHE